MRRGHCPAFGFRLRQLGITPWGPRDPGLPAFAQVQGPSVTPGHSRLLTKQPTQAVSSRHFLSHCITSAFPFTAFSRCILVCLPVYLTPPCGLKSHKDRNPLSCLPQGSQHSAQWRTLSRRSTNICLMNKMSEEMYEITNFLFKVLIYRTLICYGTDIRGPAWWNGVSQHESTLILNLELNCN